MAIHEMKASCLAIISSWTALTQKHILKGQYPFQIPDVNTFKAKSGIMAKLSSAHEKPQLLSAANLTLMRISEACRPPPNRGRIIMSQNSGLGLLTANRASWHVTGYCV